MSVFSCDLFLRTGVLISRILLRTVLLSISVTQA